MPQTAHRTIFERVELLLTESPRLFEFGEAAPPGWSILAETYLCKEGLVIGLVARLIELDDGHLIQYETIEKTTPAKLLDPDPWDCRTCDASAEPSSPGWVSDYGSALVARFCPECVERWSARHRRTAGTLV